MEADGDHAEGVDTFSTGSNLGRRDAYTTFVKQQEALGEGGCILTFFDLLTHFDIARIKESEVDGGRADEEDPMETEGDLRDDPFDSEDEAEVDEQILESEVDDEEGLPELMYDSDGVDSECEADEEVLVPPATFCLGKNDPPPLLHKVGQCLLGESDQIMQFRIGDLRFTRSMREKKICPNVLSLCPYLTYDLEDERSAYAILLMHRVWENGDEANILPAGSTAVDYLRSLITTGSFLDIDEIVTPNRRIRTDLAKNGTPMPGTTFGGEENNDSDDEAEDYFNCDDTVEFDESANNDLEEDVPTEGDESRPIQSLSGVSFMNLSHKAFARGKDCVNRIVRSTELAFRVANTIAAGSKSLLRKRRKIFPYSNSKELTNELQAIVKRLKTVARQHKTFEHIKAKLEAKDGAKLKLVVTGAGGTGKTEIIHATVRLSKLTFGKTRGKYGPVIVVAPSGAAASNAGAY